MAFLKDCIATVNDSYKGVCTLMKLSFLFTVTALVVRIWSKWYIYTYAGVCVNKTKAVCKQSTTFLDLVFGLDTKSSIKGTLSQLSPYIQ